MRFSRSTILQEVIKPLTGVELRIRSGACELLDVAKKVKHTTGSDLNFLGFQSL